MLVTDPRVRALSYGTRTAGQAPPIRLRPARSSTTSLLAQDAIRLDRLRWTMETSLLKTLAAEHRSRITTMV